MNKLHKLSPYHLSQVDAIRARIAELTRFQPELICLGTNEGTFSAEECHRKTGCGDPVYGNYTRWTDWQGNETVEGCDPDQAPGYFRTNANAKAQIAEAKQLMREKGEAIKAAQAELAEFQLDQR